MRITYLIPKPASGFKRDLLHQNTPKPTFRNFQAQILTIGENLGKHVRLKVLKYPIERIDLVLGFGVEGA